LVDLGGSVEIDGLIGVGGGFVGGFVGNFVGNFVDVVGADDSVVDSAVYFENSADFPDFEAYAD
jgi:hypothetical protein